jgi:hypothetical protein
MDPPGRLSRAVECRHDDFHGIRTAYDRRSGVLVYFWICERCGKRLAEAKREEYRPSYDPHGNDRFVGSPAR